jgi:ubiquinone/menaquinone biosynthesis C-methylase UbiE
MRSLILFTLCILSITSWLSCKSENASTRQINSPVEQSSIEGIKNENLGRSSWQKPNLVIEKLGDVSKKTIVDIGAGTGYFTFRIAFKAAKVIAIDIDPNMIALIESFRMNLPSEIQSKIESRLVSKTDPMLKENECDIAVIINTIGYINNASTYLTKVRHAMKDSASIMIVDFNEKKLPMGTSASAKVSAEEIIKALADAGFKNAKIDDTTLDYQFIITAENTK